MYAINRLISGSSTYGSCHGHDCMIVGFTSTYVGCHGHDCMTATIGRSKSYNHDHESYHR